MKKNGTIAQRLLHRIRKRNAKVVSLSRVAAMTEFLGVDRAGRALRVLEANGHLEKIAPSTFLVIDRSITPALPRKLTWSNPSLSNAETLIAAHILKPRVDELRTLSFHYGPKAVESVLRKLRRRKEIDAVAAKTVKHTLHNIVVGFKHGT
jgi:hypothetical protein